MSHELVDRLLKGETRAVARAITIVENGAEGSADIMKGVFPKTGNAVVIGITGAPGAGKSSLVDKLALHYRSQDHKGRYCRGRSFKPIFRRRDTR